MPLPITQKLLKTKKYNVALRDSTEGSFIPPPAPSTLRPPVPCFLKHNKEKRIPWSHDDHAFPHVMIFRLSYVTCNHLG